MDLADCSQTQRDLWYAERLGVGACLAFGLRVHGAVDAGAFHGACADLVSAHADLLSRFAERDGEPVRIRHTAVEIVDDPGHLTTPFDVENGSLIVDDPGRLTAPFDVENGPLVRFGLTEEEAVTSVVAAFHHLVFDGMSRDIAARDLIRCYEARLDGRRAAIGPIPGYHHYVERERRILAGGPPPGWRDTIDVERVALSDILNDGPTATLAEPMSVRLDEERLAGLDRVAEATGTSRHAALLATFAATLAGYASPTRSPVPTIGMPMSTRPPEFAEAAGVFVNEVPLALDPAPGTDFQTFLKAVSERVRTAFTLRSFPVSALRRQAGLPPWRPSVIFGYRRAGLPERLDLAGQKAEYQAVLPGYRTSAELELQLIDHGTSAACQIGYAPARFTANAVRTLLAAWLRTIDLATTEPSRPLRTWSPPTTTEHPRTATARGIVVGAETVSAPDDVVERREVGVGPSVVFDGAGTVHGLVAEQAARTPGAIAVRDEAGEVTYAELDRHAEGVASRLRAAGVSPEDRVLVCLPRSSRLVAALLGVLKAGGCYVPLDPDDPPARRAHMARDSGAQVLIADQDAALEAVPGAASAAPDTALDAIPDAGSGAVPGFAGAVVHAGGGAKGILPGVTGGHLAYALYTSGSTGAPKAAMVTHAALRNRLLWMQDAYRLSPGDRVLHKTAIGFDVSGWELWWPLVAGATVVVAPPGAHRDTARLARIIQVDGVTVTHFVPSALRVFLDEPGAAVCSSLRLVVCSGETLPADLVARFHDRLGARLENLYGPTEAAIDVTAVTCPPGMDPVPIGGPIANTCVRVLDPDLRPVPVGVTGEICLSGVQLARGYLGRPDLTAERFVADHGGGRLYRTGDLGRYRDDGALEYLGRIDHQVKIRGRRVEPAEIETTLRAHPGVRAAAVLGVGTDRGEQALAAYLVPRTPGERPDLDRWIRDALPEAMVPSTLTWLDELPLTSSGKLDRKALPPPGTVTAAYVEPRSDPERALARIWAELFGLRRVGANDDFFDLGGHSLLATRTLSRLREAFGVDLPMRVVFERPTVAALGAAVDEARGR